MRWKNLTKEAKLDAFKSLVNELELDDDTIPQFEIKPIKDYIPRALERLNNPELFDGVRTGYTDLDNLIGGFADEELIVVGGGTGRGKSQFVQCIMMNQVLQNNPILFVTLEMSQIETTIRFMRMIKTKCDSEVLPELPIFFYAGDIINLKILDEAIRQGKEQGIKVVFIDHLHFFSRSTENSAQEIGLITREIKLMARKYKLPIVLVSHIRKLTTASSMPDLDDLKDSSAIAQDADTVLMVNRDIETTDKHEQRTMMVRTAKNRRTGKLGFSAYYLDDNYYLEEVDYVVK
jgi:replicative DNA helicase